MAAAPMYITKHRAEAVDFTHPFLTVEATILLRRPRPGHETHIKSAYDLINQSEYIFGTLNTGVIIRALRTSNDTLQKLLWQKMRSFHPAVFTKSNEEGINRVRRDRYAYILPSVIGDYIKERMPCDLVTVDRFLMERGYGMAVQKGSGLLPKLNHALELLKKGGYLEQIYKKWWIKTGECNGIKSSKMYSLNGCPSTQNFDLQLLSILALGVVHVLLHWTT